MMQKHRMTFLLFGSSGQVGIELKKFLACIGDLYLPLRTELNVNDLSALRKYIIKIKPKWIINAIAYTNVDMAEKEQKMAHILNAVLPKNLALISEEIGAKLIHLSTDYVFDGRGNNPYNETSKTNPINIYGQSKLLGEQNISYYSSQHIILRTSWVYGLWRNNFLLKMIDAMKQDKPLTIVYDQIGSPTWSRHIAQGIIHIIHKINLKEEIQSNFNEWGLYHLTSEGNTNWYDFTKQIRLLSKIRYNRKINKIKSDEFNSFAERPKFSILSNKKILEIFDFKIPPWKTALIDCLIDLRRY